MNEMIIWLFKSAVIFTVLGFYYHFLLRNSKRHQTNRGVLWSIMLFSLFIPLIEITVKTVVVDAAVTPQNLSEGTSDSSGALFALNWMMALGVAYLIGLLWHLTGLTRQLMRLYLVMRSSKKEIGDAGIIYIFTDKLPTPSTFFHYLFLQDGTSLFPEVEAHERVHIRQFHTIDLLAALLFRSVFWFHPLASRMQHYFRELHEYISDEAVIRQYGLDAYLQILDVYTEHKPGPVLCHTFASFIQKRIQMISKNPSPRIFPFLGVAIMISALFAGMSFKTSTTVRKPNPLTESRDTLPPPKPSRAMVIDTIITFDPSTGKESMQVVQSPLGETEMLKKFPNTIELIDTITTYDPDTRKESVMFVKSKMIEAYNILISLELAKEKPDMEKINMWNKKGRVD